ncbi:hypothetical protein HYALB_00001776 [Hymenoscyphus albidus]|uniref:Asp/Glu racemase n=1 Tax=Hymenoscyphus albidus TaxID=595503 RepID=A0A9N9LMI9_9HELO|nr:hypothetical protein HYALB_00001776 [Hymenoscyphus albidus]
MIAKSWTIRLGVLVPSSNTALEPLTHAILDSINAHLAKSPNPVKVKVTAHFARFPVTTISLDPNALSQFDLPPIIAAAKLLAHAKVDVIGWSGTSAGWLGFERDEELCKEIEKETGIKATSSVVALNKALEIWGLKKLGLITPYTDDVQAKIIKNYERIGVQIGAAEKHLEIKENTDIAQVSEAVLDSCVEEIKSANEVEALTTFCTNLVAAQRAPFWEEKHGVPVFDTVTTVIWDMLRMCQLESRIKGAEGWGMIFEK